MTTKNLCAAACLFIATLPADFTHARPGNAGTAFTYQGQLKQGGNNVNATADFQFTLFDVPSGGAPVAATLQVDGVVIAEGVFTVDVDFGAGVFDGNDRWLDIAVRSPAGAGSFIVLTPRQAIRPAPVALFALSGNEGPQGPAGPVGPAGPQGEQGPAGPQGATGPQGAQGPQGIQGPAGAQGAQGPQGIQGPQGVQGPAGTPGDSHWSITGNNTWYTTGNVGIGTNNPSVRLHVNGSMITGLGGNIIGPSVINGFVSGGEAGTPNSVQANFATVAGGTSNTASGDRSTVAGGSQNVASGTRSMVGNGDSNAASGSHSFVAGGQFNSAGFYSFVGGGSSNAASGTWSSVPGGTGNTASGSRSLAAGRNAKANHEGTFVWGDSQDMNFASTGANQFLIRAAGGVGIGTASPTNALSVLGIADFSSIGVGTASPANPLSVVGSADFSGNVGIGTNAPNLRLTLVDAGTGVHRPSANILALHTNAAERMRITSDGKVGIGTNAPEEKLTVIGNVKAQSLVATNTILCDGPILSDSNVHAQTNLSCNGNAQIGTVATTAKLTVDGSAAKPGGGSWSSFSDRRLKHDIVPIAGEGGMLERVLSLNGYTFEYNDDAVKIRLGLPGRQIGLIAQEVQEVFPDWVDADDEGYLFVTERGTTAIFVEALRELRAEKDSQIERQQSQIDAQQQMIEQLLRRIEALEQAK